MSNPYLPASFADDSMVTETAASGQRAHRDTIRHTNRFQRRLWTVRPGVWCLVGNGLSNQTFVEGPAGLIAIDTGESIEEMRAALVEVRRHTSAPVVAVMYTHFHYVAGTRAITEESGASSIPIWGHAGIVANRTRMASEVSPVAGRGLVHQFGLLLPKDGPDGQVNVGLGLEYRSTDHAPFTPGFVAPTHTFAAPTDAVIAGLRVEITPAPSDADDSATFWFPEIGLCVNNLVWPTLFNVFAIRGEEYRDPRVLLKGMDHLLALQPAHLAGAHGPPLSGIDVIQHEATRYRDSIQFMWDQTVRGINKGLTLSELSAAIQLPPIYAESYLTTQFYGLVEHHVKQIHAGLRGWFDGDEATLFPLPAAERATRLIEGFGGVEAVRSQAQAALDANDLRWALELSTWLVRRETNALGRADGGTAQDRALLAQVLRTISQRTTSANLRNWCLTRARELDGLLDLSRFRVHRFSREQVLDSGPMTSVHTLRVVLDPVRLGTADSTILWVFDDSVQAGLHLRHGVAVPTDGRFANGRSADFTLNLSVATLALWLGGKLGLSDILNSGALQVTGSVDVLRKLLSCFEHPTLAK